MSGPALDYAYRYASPSAAVLTPGGLGLRLATCGGEQEHPHFFRGRLTAPRRTADLLRGVVEVVQSRFFTPPAMLARILALADPVVTSGGEMLRFEAFSACCSTYGRVDLLPQAVDGEWLGRGTTNVDFNAPMRAALAKIRDSDSVTLSVGSDAVELASVETTPSSSARSRCRCAGSRGSARSRLIRRGWFGGSRSAVLRRSGSSAHCREVPRPELAGSSRRGAGCGSAASRRAGACGSVASSGFASSRISPGMRMW